MKREEKNQMTRRNILESAEGEFARNGYAGASMNDISAAGGLSKGILYHYFETKEALYLACAEDCFAQLKAHIEGAMSAADLAPREMLATYFCERMAFFHAHPIFQRIFCESWIAPPDVLKEQLRALRKPLDALNREIMVRILSGLPLREEITMERAVDLISHLQDFTNVRYREANVYNLERHEKDVRLLLDVLLNGMIERTGDSHAEA